MSNNKKNPENNSKATNTPEAASTTSAIDEKALREQIEAEMRAKIEAEMEAKQDEKDEATTKAEAAMEKHLEKQEKTMKQRLKEEKKVKIFIPEDPLNPNDVVPVGLNGVIYAIPTGQEFEVPESIYNVWKYSFDKTREANKKMDNLLKRELKVME